MKINELNINNEKIVKQIEALLRRQKDYAVLPRRDLQYYFKNEYGNENFVDLRKEDFTNIIKEVARRNGFKYIIYTWKVINGERWAKFYFFYDLNHELAKILLDRKRTKVIKV